MFKTASGLTLKVFRSFTGAEKLDAEDLSSPISVRVPLPLLAEIDAQAESIGSNRYRSKHLVNLLYLGANMFRVQEDSLKALSPDHLSLVTRLNYVFSKFNLSVPVVAEDLGYDSIEKVSGWLNGRVFPTFAELDQLAAKYMLNEKWLKTGEVQYVSETGNMLFAPYQVESRFISRSMDELLSLVLCFRERKIKTLRLIRSESGDVLLNFEYGDNCFASLIFSGMRLLNLNAVGRSGEADLAALAGLLYLLENQINEFAVMSLTLSDADYELIASGQASPVDVMFEFRNDSWDRLMYSKETLATHQSKLWDGACELFHYIQRLRDLEDNIGHIESEKQAFAQIRYAYQDRCRRA